MRRINVNQIVITNRTENLNRYFDEIKEYPLLSIEDEIELARRIQEGDKEAEEKLVLANMRFVVSVAKQFQTAGVELSDLIMAGNIGLIKAARRFDPTRGFKFISYAVWWVRQEIIEEIGRQKGFKNGSQMSKLKRIEQKIDKERQEAGNMNIGLDDVPLERWERDYYKRYNRQYISIESPVREDSELTLERFLGEEDERMELISQKVEYIINLLKGILGERDYFIMNKYFGLEGEQYPLDTVAREVGLTRERCRQIIEEARKKILERVNPKTLKSMIID